MSEREFWILVRSALLLFVDAIERRYNLRRTAERKIEADSIAVLHTD